ncbi:hypothetical protein K469DRAFT_701474 [Zopfia rhizophila CBS 207.26]|uniref:Protein HRI1 n=1 Tax=Zopfia rhizophila CBS 207.26 TaxID=1314779 RepID=A0A6A6DBA6_9PEZI|nr:hypothetical protein K469DRAFT_701474 [Zopfia rhizophila CBS 207.26]
MVSQNTPPGDLIVNEMNRTQLQSIIQISISAPNGSPIRISAKSPKLSLTILARQTWSAYPDQPLTLCTRHTPLDIPILGRDWTGGRLKQHLKISPSEKIPTESAQTHHYKEPAEGDWQQKLGFVTIPPASSGKSYSVTREIELGEVFETDGLVKERGVFEVKLDDMSFKKSPGIEWWNWGDLEGEFKGKKLSYRADPKLNDKNREEERKKLPDDVVLPYGCWKNTEDDEGNQMAWLEVDFDERPLRVEIVE